MPRKRKTSPPNLLGRRFRQISSAGWHIFRRVGQGKGHPLIWKLTGTSLGESRPPTKASEIEVQILSTWAE